jgi:hypothetical protein
MRAPDSTTPRSRSAVRLPTILIGQVIALLITMIGAMPAFSDMLTAPKLVERQACDERLALKVTSGHVLFRYTVTEAGKVRRIKLLYADVEPPDKKKRYVEVLKGCLENYKYEPAGMYGMPQSVTVKKAFHEVPTAGDDDEKVLLPDGRLVSRQALDRVRAAQLAFADHLLKDRRDRVVRGDGWVLRTDAKKSLVPKIREALDIAILCFDAAFPDAPPQPEDAPLDILLFAKDDAYRQFIAFDNFVPRLTPTAGKYDGETRMIYTSTGDVPLQMAIRILVHEATHHLIQTRLSKRWEYPPRWLNEGIATYIETMKVEKRAKVDLAALDRGWFHHGRIQYQKKADSLTEVLSLNMANLPELPYLFEGMYDHLFFGANADVAYGISWLLVHYLINAEGGKYRRGFERWIYAERGDEAGDSLADAVGHSYASLQDALPAYLLDLD